MTAILTLEEAAKRLKISSRTLYDLCRDGKIPHARVGRQIRFTSESLEDWLERQTQQQETIDE